MARNLTLDIQPLNIPNPSKTKVYGIWFGAYGNTTYGERAYLDDVSLVFLPHPVPVFSANPAVGSAPLTVSFDASGSGETSGGSGIGITDYKWKFGDGAPVQSGIVSRVSHTYNSPGDFVVVLTVMDSNGQTRNVSSVISVTGENVWFGPVAAGSLGVVLVAGVFLLRGRSHSRKARELRRRFRK
jgi:PKD repeat protein